MNFKTFKPPPGCVSVEEHERELVKTAELLEVKARVLLESDAKLGLAYARDLSLAAIRARTQAAELAVRREGLEISAQKYEHHRQVLGIRGPGRLKRT